MTVKLNLPPEVEASLVAQAQFRGLFLEDYLSQIMHEQSRIANAPTLSAEEWIEEFQSWIDSIPDTPILSDHALSRETMYPDRW